MSKSINVNPTNSKVIDGKLFITGLKMAQLRGPLADFIVKASTVNHPTMGLMYEYDGPYSRNTFVSSVGRGNS